MRKVFVLLFVLAFALPVFPDQVTLDNGDRVAGAIVRSDAKTLVIETVHCGRVDPVDSKLNRIAYRRE